MPELPAVIPLLVYRDIERAHDFLVEAFGFAPGGVSRDPDGNVVHGEVYAGPQVIWLHREQTEEGFVSAVDSSSLTGELVVNIADVDAHYERARAASATIDYGPMDQPYGVREYGVRDLEGHRWSFVTPLP